MRAFNFSCLPVAVCLALRTSLTGGDNEFVLVWSFAKDTKGAMVDEVLDFHADGVQPGGANIDIKF